MAQTLEAPALVEEMVGDEPYQYYPLGEFVVSAPKVCKGRPTFKYTRVEVADVLKFIGAGHPVEELAEGYQGKISKEAIQEAIELAAE
jgi:uncharacterized protein (DUF433 family)